MWYFDWQCVSVCGLRVRIFLVSSYVYACESNQFVSNAVQYMPKQWHNQWQLYRLLYDECMRISQYAASQRCWPNVGALNVVLQFSNCQFKWIWMNVTLFLRIATHQHLHRTIVLTQSAGTQHPIADCTASYVSFLPIHRDIECVFLCSIWSHSCDNLMQTLTHLRWFSSSASSRFKHNHMPTRL